jgi:hypothetical protein
MSGIKRDQGYIFRQGSTYDASLLFVVDNVRWNGRVQLQMVKHHEEGQPVDGWVDIQIEDFYRMIDQGFYMAFGEHPHLTKRFR